MTTADKIYKAVMSNLYGRNGYDHIWDSLDKGIKEEIKREVTADIQRILDKEV